MNVGQTYGVHLREGISLVVIGKRAVLFRHSGCFSLSQEEKKKVGGRAYDHAHQMGCP